MDEKIKVRDLAAETGRSTTDVMRVLRELYRGANLCAIDFEAGTSRANFTNRLKLFMAQAKSIGK